MDKLIDQLATGCFPLFQISLVAVLISLALSFILYTIKFFTQQLLPKCIFCLNIDICAMDTLFLGISTKSG